jgi:ATP-dependent exoDNAse (exonuclease V) beta subunit
VAIDEAQQSRAASGGTVRDAQEVVAQATGQVQEKAEEVKAQALDRVREEVDTRSRQAGDQATSFGQALHKAADHLDGAGNQSGAKAAHRMADQVERLGSYLMNSSSDRFLADLERFGRQRPWAAGAAAALAGFVGARFLKASADRRFSSHHSSHETDRAVLDGEQRPALPPIAAATGGNR